MSELEARFVKKGLWVNEAKGAVLGKVYTTETRTGTILVALLAVFSSLATAHLWNLVIFYCHQRRAHGRPADGLFKQQQALLRTLPPPTSLMTDTVKLWWSWRHRTDNVLLRCIIFPLLGILFAASTLTVSLTSSYIVDTTNLEVLVDSPSCASINLPRMAETQLTASTLVENISPVMESYTRDCYGKETSDLPSRCRNTFIAPNIPVKNASVPCPFSEEMCDGEALELDSGLLDMNHYFGLNLHKEDRLQFRKRTTCSILPIDGYYDVLPATDFDGLLGRGALPEEEIIALKYNAPSPSEDVQAKYTFAHSLAVSNISQNYEFRVMQSYASPDWETAGALAPRYAPLPSLARQDADVALIALWSNNVLYAKPVNDPLFAAHANASFVNYGATFEQFRPDHPGRTLGCAQQWQFCLPKLGENACTPFMGVTLNIPQNVTQFSHTTSTQRAVIQLLLTSSVFADITNAPVSQYSLAGSAVQFGVAYELADDQWKKELVMWESASWAALQILVSDYAVGPVHRDPLADQYTDQPTSVGDKTLCHAQKMRKAGGFANISVFGLAFLLTVSGTIALTDIILLRFLIFLSRFRRALAPKIDRWIQDGVFQLQRRAFEADRKGYWVGLDNEIPTTRSKELLGELSSEVQPRGDAVVYAQSEQASSMRDNTDSASTGQKEADLRPKEPLTVVERETSSTLGSK